ncbi:MAG: hypothetical protein KBT34_05355, partial [Prevotella sp.]|nr:hypothetical protein [Candidatus Prevotella equi]
MKNLRLFETKSDLVAAHNTGLAMPNVSLVNENGKVYYFGNTEAGDIAYWDGSLIQFVKASAWEDTLGTPVGVVVVPSTHTDNGKSIVMSLANMSMQNPEKGSLAKQYIANDNYMPWGDYGVDVPNLLTCGTLPVTDVDGVSEGTESYGNFTSDEKDGTYTVYTGGDAETATKMYINTFKNGRLVRQICMMRDSVDEDWYEDCDNEYDSFIPSPYTQDGGKNTKFFKEGTTFAEGLSGKTNTGAILAMCSTANKNATPVSPMVGGSAESKKQNYPAAICASRYKTSGTNKGDWYLPSLAECMYLTARYNKINDALKKLGAKAVQMGELGLYNANLGSWLWSSSE